MAANYREMPNVSVGEVFALAIATIRGNPLVTVGVTLLFGTLPGILLSSSNRFVQSGADLGWISPSAFFWLIIVTAIGSMFLSQALTQAMLTKAVVAHSVGRKATMAESLLAGISVLLPVILLTLLLTIGVALGLILLIVPGVALYVTWSVAVPVLVEERCGPIAALRRSADLTDGNRWRILGIVGLLFFAAAMASAAVEFGTGLQNEDWIASYANPLYLALDAIATTAIGVIWGSAQAALYVRLKSIQEGPASAVLAEVFA